MDEHFYRQQAQRIRELAERADPFTRDKISRPAVRRRPQSGRLRCATHRWPNGNILPWHP